MRKGMEDALTNLTTLCEGLPRLAKHVQEIQPDQLFLAIYDNDPFFREWVEQHTQGQVITVSDLDGFKTVLKENGKKRLFVDIRSSEHNGIDVCEQLNLKPTATQEIIFISNIMPSEVDLIRINRIGRYVPKNMIEQEFNTPE